MTLRADPSDATVAADWDCLASSMISQNQVQAVGVNVRGLLVQVVHDVVTQFRCVLSDGSHQLDETVVRRFEALLGEIGVLAAAGLPVMQSTSDLQR